MSNERINRTDKYKKIIDSIKENEKIAPKDKKDIVGGVATSMRSEMFGGTSLSDALILKKTILETDSDITTAYTSFKKERNMSSCICLKKLCIKQKKALEAYAKIDKTSIGIKNKNLDALIEQCEKFESKTKSLEDDYAKKLQPISEKIAGILQKDFKTRTLNDYKNLLNLANEGKGLTLRAEKENIKVLYLKGMSIFTLDKHIDLANKQIQYFEKINSQNEEKLRALNQEIINALVPLNERGYNVSLNIIRLCETMKRQIEFLSSKGAKIPKLRFTDINNLDKCIAIEQKRIDDEKERKRKIEAERNRRMQECVAKVSSYDRELAKYAESSNCYNLSFEECQSIMSTARKLKREIDYLKENKYKVPQITWYNPDVLIQRIERRIEKIKEIRSEAISDVKNRDQAISGMIHRDYKVLSVDECRQIIGICKEQKRKIEYYKNKGVHVSGLNNGNMDYLIDKFEDICQNKINREKEQRERERQQRERERQQREREKQQKERERQQREKERQQRERERQQREREKQQRERERQQREKQQKEREEERKRRAAVEVQEIYEGLKRYTAERLRIQERQDAHWKIAKRGISQTEELEEDRDEIGNVNHEINKLIGRLMRHPKQYSCYKLAMDFLEHEIERCQHIRDDRSEHIKKVARGTASWRRSDGVEHWDNTNQIKYVAHLEDKIKRYKEQLSKLREMNRQ